MLMVWPAVIAGAAALAGGILAKDHGEDAAAADRASQREFAQHGVRWRVADAKAAGVHPLYALGASTPSYSPVHQVGTGAIGRSVAQAGEAIAGGVARHQEKNANKVLAALAIRQATANTQIAELDYVMMADAYAQQKSGVGNVNAQQDRIENAIVANEDQIKVVPKEIVSRSSTDKSMTPGSEPAWRKVDMGGGTYILAPQSDEGWAEGLEGIAPQILTAIKNYTHFTGRTWDWGIKNLEKIRNTPMFQQLLAKIKRADIKYPAHRTSSGKIKEYSE